MMTQPLSFWEDRADADVIEAAQRGSRSAFRTLYDRYSALVARRSSRLLGGTREVDDVVQEVFVQVHRSLGKFDTAQPFSNWVYRVTRNVAFSHLRRAPKRIDPVGLALLREPAEAWQQLQAREQVRALDAALLQLDDINREAFVLYALEGLTLAEISELTDTSINTVAARVRRTRDRMRDVLDRQEFDRQRGTP